jgi:hypothetical protein
LCYPIGKCENIKWEIGIKGKGFRVSKWKNTKSGPNLLFDEANFKIVEPDGIPLKQFLRVSSEFTILTLLGSGRHTEN